MNLIFFIITMSFVCSNENDVYTFKTIYKVGDIDKYTNDQVLNFDIGGYENQQNQSFLSIQKYLGKENEYILFEKNIRGWKGDIPFYSYSTKKINKMGYKFKLSSILALKKTIKNISKKTLF